MSLRLNEFRLMSYKERELLVVALMLYAIHRPEEIEEPRTKEALEALEHRLAATQCMEGGCSICGDDRMESDYNE